MPRSIQDIIDHADALARKFEEYEPSAADEIPVEEYLLQRAVRTRAAGEQAVLDAVIRARESGISWSRIGDVLGTSAQAAHQRYGPVVTGD